MNLTTKDIIRLLPLDPPFKQDLLNRYDTLTADQKFEIEQMVWDVYDELYQLRLEANTEEAFIRVQEQQEAFDEDFYKRIKEKTDNEMMQKTATLLQHQAPAISPQNSSDSVEQPSSPNLDATRQELQKILQQTN
jgi:hypothetical protein